MGNIKKTSVLKRVIYTVLSLSLVLALLSGCSGNNNEPRLSPKDPVTISIWHYYNGGVANAFDSLVTEFNETAGLEIGVIVEAKALGSVSELEKAVISAANKEVGSMEIPNIFASYADTAYEAEQLGILADLDDYFTAQEQEEYIDSFIEEGRIGINGELRIFPVAKSTEVFMLNDTDWLPFAEECNFTYDDLNTMESITKVSKAFYEWTDAKTPDIPDDGKAFFGRDSMANMFIIASMEHGEEIFRVEAGKGEISINEEVMQKIWDYYYVPYISGYYTSYGRYSSDDVKVGDLLCYVGSTSSALYFPSEVTTEDETYPVKAKVFPVPDFGGGEKVLVQQGAGMVVTKGESREELASVEFLKWFTNAENNILFSAKSGYMPVKKEAADFDKIMDYYDADGEMRSYITDETLEVALSGMESSRMYTNKAFLGGAGARNVLEYHLQDKANADREEVLRLIGEGMSHEEAVAEFSSQAEFKKWLADFTEALEEIVNK